MQNYSIISYQSNFEQKTEKNAESYSYSWTSLWTTQELHSQALTAADIGIQLHNSIKLIILHLGIYVNPDWIRQTWWHMVIIRVMSNASHLLTLIKFRCVDPKYMDQAWLPVSLTQAHIMTVKESPSNRNINLWEACTMLSNLTCYLLWQITNLWNWIWSDLEK